MPPEYWIIHEMLGFWLPAAQFLSSTSQIIIWWKCLSGLTKLEFLELSLKNRFLDSKGQAFLTWNCMFFLTCFRLSISESEWIFKRKLKFNFGCFQEKSDFYILKLFSTHYSRKRKYYDQLKFVNKCHASIWRIRKNTKNEISKQQQISGG